MGDLLVKGMYSESKALSLSSEVNTKASKGNIKTSRVIFIAKGVFQRRAKKVIDYRNQ